MKKTIGLMILGAFLLQSSVLWGLELWATQSVNVTNHTLPEATSQWRHIALNIPMKNARGISLSYQGEYLVWNEGDGFTVWDIEQERPLYKEKMPPGQKVALVQWLNDRNRLLLITEQSTVPVVLPPSARSQGAGGKNATQMVVEAMDKVDSRPLPRISSVKQAEISFLNADGSQRIFSTRIRGLAAGEEVREATVSTQSNLLYLTLGDKRFAAALYRVDIQHDALKVPMRAGMRVEKLSVGPAQGHIYAEFWDSEAADKPFVQGVKGMQVTQLAQRPLNYLLMGIDRKNNMYLGVGPGRQVHTIWVWDGKKLQKERELPETIHRDNVIVGADGQIGIVDEPSSLLKVYSKGTDAPAVFSFEAGAKVIRSDNRFIGLVKIGETAGELWLLSL